jgi:hypothetical protein
MEAMLPLHAANTSPDKEPKMKTKLFSILIASLLAMSGTVLGQDTGQSKDLEVSGGAGAGGMGTSQNSQDAAKLNEYRDLSDGPFGFFDLRGRSIRFYLDGYGENLGRDDMYLDFRGGMYDQLKFDIYGNWLTHNFGFGPNGARTPFVNPGSASLTLFSADPNALGNSNVPPWTSFNFAVKRHDAGGSFEISHGSPWYFRVDTNELRQSGIDKVDAAALGTSPGNGFIDLPYPVDYTTHNISLEGGYQKLRGHVSVNWLESHFSNENVLLFFQNPFFGFGTDTATFYPNNNYARIAVDGVLRQLFWNSTLSARATYDRDTDSQDMINSVLNTSGSNVLASTFPSAPTFNGEVENATAHASFASLPTSRLDTRAYYNFYSRSNTSTDMTFQTLTAGLSCSEQGLTSPTPVNVFCESLRYGYTKHNPGFEAGYRLTPGNRLSAGYDYLHTKRNRFDADRTGDNKVYVQWSNASLDNWTVRVKYQFLDRRSHFLTDNSGFNANDPFFLERFSRSFDVANLNQHIVKGYLDWTPLPLLDFGFEAYYKRNNYKDVTLGRLNDRRKEIYGSVSYGDPSKFRVTLFGDIEFINYDSFHRTINNDTCTAASPNCFDPRVPATTAAFNWAGQVKDKNWTVELGADWPVSTKLTLKGSAMVQQTNGNVDFQSETLANGSPATLLFPITAFDNTRHQSVWPRAVYLITRHFELTLGYSFEKYTYLDDQFTGYQYTIGSGTTTSYLSGIYAFPNYQLHLGYGQLRYLF